jgi:hypothetical protein
MPYNEVNADDASGPEGSEMRSIVSESEHDGNGYAMLTENKCLTQLTGMIREARIRYV